MASAVHHLVHCKSLFQEYFGEIGIEFGIEVLVFAHQQLQYKNIPFPP